MGENITFHSPVSYLLDLIPCTYTRNVSQVAQ